MSDPSRALEYPLRFTSDAGPRQGLQIAAARQHPGKLHLGFLAYLATQEFAPGWTVLDPMAGAGSLTYLTYDPWRCHVLCNEIEPHWVAAARASWDRLQASLFRPPGTACFLEGDARSLPARLPAVRIDALLISPPYGDSLGRSRIGKGLQAHLAAEPPHWQRGNSLLRPEPAYGIAAQGATAPPAPRNPAQIGNLRGRRYTAAMGEVYRTCVPLVRPGGVVIVVLKNSVRRNQEVDLIGQATAQLGALGLSYERTHYRAVTPGAFHNIRRRHNPQALVLDREAALVLRVPGG